MLWVFVFTLAASLFAFVAARQSRIIEPHALGLDFGDSPELVEYTLRAVANSALSPLTVPRLKKTMVAKCRNSRPPVKYSG
ncbi:MAG: hypothetical protein DDT20_01458 [Firmicutes bacterium]|nr:hypothetical protein [Bacillota bacterium]